MTVTGGAAGLRVMAGLGLLARYRGADREAQATLGAAAGQHLAAVSGGHAAAEAVLVDALAVGGLKCAFHCL